MAGRCRANKKALISLCECNACNKVSFYATGLIKHLKTPICGYANREGLVKPAQIYTLFRAFALCIQNIETLVKIQADIWGVVSLDDCVCILRGDYVHVCDKSHKIT